ncbi:hypothetical protein L1987_87493 [Smallanthus sonchifolius]|nr:hypothetical protein L1987_87493 [Smallanthus sonchifolius]
MVLEEEARICEEVTLVCEEAALIREEEDLIREEETYSQVDPLGNGICAFRDKEEINQGEALKPEIERAIKASRSSIVVLSKNYATSTWCLEELVLILKQRRVFNHFVLPIFYHVTPTDVRKQKGSFVVEKDRWKTALTEVANLSGFTLSGYGS